MRTRIHDKELRHLPSGRVYQKPGQLFRRLRAKEPGVTVGERVYLLLDGLLDLLVTMTYTRNSSAACRVEYLLAIIEEQVIALASDGSRRGFVQCPVQNSTRCV